jgi:rod shape-determining protein MreD
VSIMGLNLADLDLLTIIIAYLFLFYGQTATVMFAFGQGILIDLFSGGLHGLFTFLYLCVFGGVYLGSQFFNLQHPRGQMIIVALAVLLKKGMFFMMLTVFHHRLAFSKDFLWVTGFLVMGTGLISPILFYLFDCLRADSLEDTHSSLNERP